MPRLYYTRQPYPNELYHHGIKNQKWGVRRFQNPDGTLTEAGKQRYAYTGRGTKNLYKDAKKQHRENERNYTTAGKVYKTALKEQKRAHKSLDKFKSNYGIDKTTDTSKMSKKVREGLDRREASVRDSDRNAAVWEKHNKKAVSEMKAATKDLNKMLSERGKKPLKDIPTKTLNNGKEIVNGRIFTAGEYAQSFMLSLASYGAAVALGSPVYVAHFRDADSYARRYRNETEKQTNYNRFQEYNKYRSKKKQGYYK